MSLLLFDVDGTLVRPLGLGRRAFLSAIEDLFGASAEPAPFPYDGLLDTEIARRTLSSLQAAPDPTAVDRLLAAYLERLSEQPFPPADRCRCEGLPGALEHCLARGHRVALLTGNVRGGALVKLRAAGLDAFFADGGGGLLGAFGEDAAERPGLVPVALERCGRHFGSEFEPASVWIVGDSERDIFAAKAAGVRCVAVGTGHTPPEVLRGLAPDAFLPSLKDTEALCAAVEGGPQP
jgi:phosphoglycolate phosphatase-like HAD superfamily hydrolase